MPLIGLAIDGATVYYLKARLSQAIDAGALAAARSLSAGLTLDEQAASAQETAKKYFGANFKSNYWGSTVTDLEVNVTQDAISQRLVTISATATAPLYFLRLLGKTNVTIAASGQALRRDVNVMLVLDRSSSMGNAGAITPMVNAATSFVNQFANGRDNVGVVIFGGSYFLAAPTQNFQPSIVNDIKQTTSSGNTGTAQALWVAYKALAGLNQPGALNVILFFTDGLPNGFTADFTGKTADSTGAPTGVDLRSHPTSCDNLAVSLVGWVSQTSGYVNSPGTTHGLFRLTTANGAVSDPKDGSNNPSDGAIIQGGSGCQFSGSGANVKNDFTGIPTVDYYGNQTNPVDFYKSTLYPQATGAVTLIGGMGNALEVAAASFNAADQAVKRMRAGAINGIVPTIYTISLLTTPSEPPDPEFMKRVSNTTDSEIYDSTKPTGLYIDTQHQDELPSAFLRIASEILRLSE